MKLAVCLLSCGRHDLTRRAVASLAEHNDLADRRLVLLQADEPSMGLESLTLGTRAGFKVVHAPKKRAGQMAASCALIRMAGALDCSHVLWLENDWVSAGPLPWDFIEKVATLRLFGARKRLDDHPRAPAGEHVLGTKDVVAWSRLPSGWEYGLASWAMGGSIIEHRLLATHMAAPRLKDIALAIGPIPTLRPARNIMHSIGDETTEGFLA